MAYYTAIDTTINTAWSTPDSAALDLTDHIDLRVLIAPTSWTPAGVQALVAKWLPAGNQRSYQFSLQPAGLRLDFSPDGTSVVTQATVSLPSALTSRSDPSWVRCLALSNVGGVSTVDFYYSINNGTTWVPIGGTHTSATTGPIFASTAPGYVGWSQATGQGFSGHVYRAQVWDSSGPTLKADLDLRHTTTVGAYTATTGEVWTPGGSAVITADQYLTGVDFASGTLPTPVAQVGVDVTAAPFNAKGDGTQTTNGAITAASTALTGTFASSNGDAGKLIQVRGAGVTLVSGTTTAAIVSGATNNILQDTSATFTESMRGAIINITGFATKLIVWDVIDTHNIHFSRATSVGAPNNPVTTTITSGTTYTIADDLRSTITASTSATATLANAAGTTVTAARYLYGTDNYAAMTAAHASITHAGGVSNYGGAVFYPAGWYLFSQQLLETTAGLSIFGAPGTSYSNLLNRGPTKFTPMTPNGGSPFTPFYFNFASDDGPSLQDFHIIGMYDTPGGLKATRVNNGLLRNVTISDMPQGDAETLDGTGGNIQYWEHYNFKAVRCKRGAVGVGSSTGHHYSGGILGETDNSLNIYPALGTRGVYGMGGSFLGVRGHACERIIDTGPFFGGAHNPQIIWLGGRLEHFSDCAAYIDSWGCVIDGPSFSSSSSGGTAAIGIKLSANARRALLRPGEYVPANITMYSLDPALDSGAVNIVDPDRYTATTNPTTGTWVKGEHVRNTTGSEWVCTASGTPGSWQLVLPIATASVLV